MKQYILIGGNGFIGKALQKQLQGKPVYVVGRSPGLFYTGPFPYFSVTELTRSEIASKLKFGSCTVIDLSFTSVSNARITDVPQFFSDNLKLVIGNLELAKMLDVEKYIYISSGGTVYGRTTGNSLNELHETNPISNYGIAKLASEKYVQMYCDDNEIMYHIVRSSNVYGPGQLPFRGQGVIATAIGSLIRRSAFTIYGNGENVRDYIYVDDFCSWIISLAEKGKDKEIYNAGSGSGKSIVEIIEIIQRLMQESGLKLKLDYQPDRNSDVKTNVLDARRIRDVTGLTATTDIETGISSSIEWIKNNFSDPVSGK